jgi:hypothetical protein
VRQFYRPPIQSYSGRKRERCDEGFRPGVGEVPELYCVDGDAVTGQELICNNSCVTKYFSYISPPKSAQRL